MKRIIYFIISLMSVFWIGCKEGDRIDHIDSSGPTPAQVTNVEVRNTHGGAVLKYTLPSDKNLLCVRAEYEIQPGVIREVKSSFYTDTLVLEGFGDTLTYNVNLYSIGKNGKVSEPLAVQVSPLTPPVHLAIKSIKETFGGVNVNIQNPMQANLVVVLMGDTADTGYQSLLQTFYTSKENASFNFRGLDTLPCNFSVYIRDRWNNLSDTVTANVTPLYEIEIPNNTWTEYYLPGDVSTFYLNLSARYMWNDEYYDINQCCAADNQLLPQILTFNLRRTIIMSRFQYWPRYTSFDFFTRGHPKIFELWGSMEPGLTGEMDETWIPLGRFETIDDGRDIYEVSYPGDGYSFDLESNEFATEPFVPVRYIRIKTISTFSANAGGYSYVMYQQIKLYGSIIN